MITDELKQTAISHAIVQAARPRSVISPVLFGVGVTLDHLFGSKLLLTILSKLGFSITSDEVTRFKQSVVSSSDENLPDGNNSFTQ